MEATMMDRKIGRGISFSIGTLIHLEEEAERTGLSVSEFVNKAVADRLQRVDNTEDNGSAGASKVGANGSEEQQSEEEA